MSQTYYDIPDTVAEGVGSSGDTKHNKAHRELARRANFGGGSIVLPDPLGTGSSDRAWMETFFDAVPAECTIRVPYGRTYLLDAPLKYRNGLAYEWPESHRFDATQFKLMDGVNPGDVNTAVMVPAIWDANNTTGGAPVQLIRPVINGNQANNTGTYGCLLGYGAHWTYYREPRLFSSRGAGLRLTNKTKDGSVQTVADSADCIIERPRIDDHLGDGIWQDLDDSQNAYMDVQLHGGHISQVDGTAVHGRRLAGWSIGYGLHLYTIGKHGLWSEDSWFDLSIIGLVIEDFGGSNGVGETWAGIKLKGYSGVGATVVGNKLRQLNGRTNPTMRFIDLEGAGDPAASVVCGFNNIWGAGETNEVGIRKHASWQTLYVAGKGSNLVYNVNTPEQVDTTGGVAVTETGSVFV